MSRPLLRSARRACRLGTATRRPFSLVSFSQTPFASPALISSAFSRSFSSAVQSAAAPVKPPFEHKPRIVVYASHASIITGANPYGSIADVFDQTWQKSFPEAFNVSKASAEEEKGEPIMTAEEQMMEDVKALGLATDLQKTIEIATKPDGTTTVMTTAKKEFEKKLTVAQPDANKRQKLIKFARSQINKTFGSNNEASFIKDFEFKTQVKVKDNNVKFWKKEIGKTAHSQIPFFLGGRIDGFHNGRLIEIKNRVKDIKHQIPEYENVQFQIYLYLLGLQEGDLLQRLKSADEGAPEYRTPIKYNDQLIKETVIPRVQIFCDFLDYFLSNPRFGVEYLMLKRGGQEKFLKDYLQTNRVTEHLITSTQDEIVAR